MNTTKSPLFVLFCLLLLFGCADNEALDRTRNKTPVPRWQDLTPDLIIGENEFYIEPCSSITQVVNIKGV